MSICHNGYYESPNTSGTGVTISGANYIQENSFSFEKIPQVCLERINISKYVKSLDPNIETSKNDIPNAENLNKLAEFTRNCSVRLVRNDLKALRDLLFKNLHNLKCDICAKVYTSEKKLKKHKENKHLLVHQEKALKRVSFSEKVIVHEINEYHRCRKCSKIFEQYSTLKVHMRREHKKQLNKTLSQRKYICDHCLAIFLSETELLKHKLSHYCDLPEKPNYESKIEFKFKVGDPLPDHFKPVIVINRIQIPEKWADESLDYIEIPNGLDVDHKKALIDQKSKKTLFSKYQCTICTRYLSNSYGLKRHMATVHKDTEQNYTDDLKCYTCEEVFAWPSLLQSHNCIRNNIPDPQFRDARPEIELQESDDYFEIPPPIVELTVYDECVILPMKMSNGNSYKIVMEEVPIEF
ncbi:zinc finger protein 91-like isoform X3 [Pieris brassicae]|uniref:zinc finger protein 91-like isoform X3 n=1 Tax=Pieris brassicae TaxID=7116 RepID=UPI001E65FAB8|nr:zinc finger protein 91-like isoform X3 [Pieris brassicae]